MLPQRKRVRLEGFDYCSDRLYFITCCVKHMRHCFGEVINGLMQLNHFGMIADTQWHWLAEQYPYVKLHAHIIMPNHMHGILEIDSERVGSAGGVRGGRDRPVPLLQIKIKLLSELMGAYKTTASKKIHLAGDPAFAWHRSFKIILFAMREAIRGSQPTSGIIRRSGKQINFIGNSTLPSRSRQLTVYDLIIT